MAHGDIHELRERVENITAIGDAVLTAQAAHLLDRLLVEWAGRGVAQLLERQSRI